ncbi:MAG: NADH-quinone oxidoreductase subunit 5 family protein, partial [Daejeonella sp.]
WLSIAGLAVFTGAIAKSAQFPLHTWLPDAMEGPTSVSSLIHAATMVAAGVFLIGRVYPIFDHLALNVITAIGTITAFMAATIALTQNNIKRILAYSTISQLGFMITAMGIGAYGESMFHLTTHALFQCLLFLAAGAVIHQLHHFKEHHHLDFDHQDIRLMGGLRKEMPIAFITMCIAAISLAGLPFSSGYLSKDALLIASFEGAEGFHGIKRAVPYILVLSSWMTVFYISRLVFKVFLGKPRFEGLNDAPPAMSRILIVLACCSVFILFSLNPFAHEKSWLLTGFADSGVQQFDLIHAVVPIVVNLVSVVVIYYTYVIYVKKNGKVFPEESLFYRFSSRAWYLNETYTLFFTRPTENISRFSYQFDKRVIDGIVNLLGSFIRVVSGISDWFDRRVVDELVNSVAELAKGIGNFSRKFQSGRLQHYLIMMLTVVISFFIINYFL